MDQHQAKLGTLQQIIDLATNHMLGGAKKKGAPQPAVVEMSVQAGNPAEMHEAAAKGEPDGDEMDQDAMKQLADMYAKDEQPKKDDEGSDEPADVNARY